MSLIENDGNVKSASTGQKKILSVYRFRCKTNLCKRVYEELHANFSVFGSCPTFLAGHCFTAECLITKLSFIITKLSLISQLE